MVLIEQISALLDYLENHQDLALGHCSRTNEGRSLSKRYWMECAQILNSISVDCPIKTPVEWRTFYNEYKSKTLKKIKQKSEESATGGDPAKKIVLTALQERLYNILERDVGEPLPGVRHNPLTVSIEQPPQRRRRQISARRYTAEDRDEVAQSRLDPIKARNTEATLIHAQAINNLAVAINRLSSTAEKMVDLMGDCVPKKKLRKVMMSSDSESE